MTPFEARLLALPDGRSLEVYVEGPEDGLPLVYHNGSPSSGLPYAPFVEEAAARGLRLVSYSRAGYAGSTRKEGRSVGDVAADVSAILDDLSAPRCYTMGWSGGGPHALATAALLSERVIAAASIAGVAPYPAEGLDWIGGMGAENVAEFGAALVGAEELRRFLENEGAWVATVTAAQVADAFGDLISEVDRASLTGEFAEWQAAGFRDSVRSGIWGWFDDDLAFLKPWGFDVHAIQRPVSIWQGEQDRMVPFSHGQWLADHVGSARVHLSPDHGHLSLAVASVGRILDELVASGGVGGSRTINGLSVAEFAFPGAVRDALVAAILRGEKRATAGLVSDYQREGAAIPQPGQRTVVVDSEERPVAIIETDEASVMRVGDVDEAFARDEGEGFESVAAWRAAHERFWHSYADETRAWLGRPEWHVTDDTLMVAERFRLIQRLDR